MPAYKYVFLHSLCFGLTVHHRKIVNLAQVPFKLYILFPALIFLSSFLSSDQVGRMVIKARYDYFTVDNLGNFYTIREDEMIKYLPNGKMFARYSNLRLGSISSVDVTNPLKILLYYRDFQQIIFLDNQLSVNSNVVALDRLGLEQTDLVCAGSNNSFWIYNKQNNELIRFNENSEKIAATGNLKQILQTELYPNYMLEHNNYLYLNCPATGIYVFDIFGAFSKIIAIKDLKQFQVRDNLIYYHRDTAFCSYDHKIFEDACKKLSGLPPSRGVRFQNKKLFFGYKDSLIVQEF